MWNAEGESETMDQSTVLIISDDAAFSSAITSRWQIERNVTLMSSDVCQEVDPEAFDMAIVGSVHTGTLPTVLEALAPTGKPVLLVSEESTPGLRESRALILHQYEGWLEALILVSGETLRRCQATAVARRMEQANATLEGNATLGRYMLEMRHTLNNALTSVLGNAELLLLEPGTLPATPRAQVATIRNMALRMHEILQRFSSLEKELKVVERQAGREEHAAGATVGS